MVNVGDRLRCEHGLYRGEIFTAEGYIEGGKVLVVKSEKDGTVSDIEASDITKGNFIKIKEEKKIMRIGKMPHDDKFNEIVNRITEMSKVMTETTPTKQGYAFYRCHVYSTNEENVIGLHILASGIKGNFLMLEIDYNFNQDQLYYGGNIAIFTQEHLLKGAIVNLIKSIMSLDFSVSHLYFDVSGIDKSAKVSAIYMLEDTKEPGSVMLFASAGSSFHDRYGIVDSKDKVRGTCLSTNWSGLMHCVDRLNKEGTQGDNARLVENLWQIGIKYE